MSWEVDLFGRLRAGAAAAAADTLAVENGARGVRLLVLSDVATNYFTLVGALRQLETVRAISAAQDETLRLVTARQRVGLATPFDVERAQTEASRARAAIPPLETLAAVSRHRIAVLIGDQAFNAASITPSTVEPTVPPARPGQPAALLQRRPDLLAASAQLDAANARRQQAMAEWFPRLFLGAVFGRESIDLNGVALGAARFTNVAALLAMPIFNAGRTQAINDIAESGQTRSRPALRGRDRARTRRTSRTRSSRSTTNGNGRNCCRALRPRPTRRSAARNRSTTAGRSISCRCSTLSASGWSCASPPTRRNTQLLLDSVQLYKALGGGWQAFEPVAEPAASANPNSPTS